MFNSGDILREVDLIGKATPHARPVSVSRPTWRCLSKTSVPLEA
jgi:hypothetical protein